MEKIAKTGFYVFLSSYLIFWLLDALRPGFVSRAFSVHLFLLLAFAFGLWWSVTVKKYTDRPLVQFGVVMILGIVLSVITWSSGQGLGTVRVLVSLVGLLTPVIFWNLVRR